VEKERRENKRQEISGGLRGNEEETQSKPKQEQTKGKTNTEKTQEKEKSEKTQLNPITKEPEYKPEKLDHGYEYLDHTADVQFHSWGSTIEEAFEQQIVAMFGYITDLSTIEIDTNLVIEVSGQDLQNLLYVFMDEFLYRFATDLFVAKEVKINNFDRENFKIKATGRGENFIRGKHTGGTEVKVVFQVNIFSSPN